MVLEHLDFQLQNNEVGPLPYTKCKNYLKMDQDLNVRAKTIKLHYLELGKSFFDMIPKSQAIKE